MNTPVSALQIAAALEMFPPTPEQRLVIEAPLAPTLVVAGAGSGKTETMANRVLWLLANGHARPDQILGLTFTRKAAGELAARINDRIRQLDDAGLMPAAAAPGGADEPGTGSSDLFNAPAVSTYNSFASRLFTDNALLLGREPESVLLSETSAWLLARRVVVEHGDGRLVSFGKNLDAVTDAVLALSRALAENPPPYRPGEPPAPHDLDTLAGSFGYLIDLPYGPPRKKIPYGSVVDSLAAVAPLPVLAELAERYGREKRRLGLIEFSDQVALALQVCQKVDRVVAAARDQYRVVLLDEYQDTSVLQTELLRTLFAHHPVMAVGDPHQSIYGWRGASSANLLGFSRDFAGVPNSQAPSMSLSYTWRNPVAVLDAANALVAPLSEALRGKPDGIQVETLKVPQGKETGLVQGRMNETIAEEAAGIARWFAERLGAEATASGAMLFRARRDMEFFAEVLHEHGVTAHVLGLGGLLSTPEVADVVSVLRVVRREPAGDTGQGLQVAGADPPAPAGEQPDQFAPGRRVMHDPEHADHVGDLRRREESAEAEHMRLDAVFVQHLGEEFHVAPGPEQHGSAGRCLGAEPLGEPEGDPGRFLGDRLGHATVHQAGLLALRHLERLDLDAVRFGPERLAQGRDERVGCVEHRDRVPPGVGQRHRGCLAVGHAGEVPGEAEQVRGACPAPAVDGLVRVADGHHRVVREQGTQEFGLQHGGVLVFVEQHDPVLVAGGGHDPVDLLADLQGEGNLVG
ncbi:MAG TPA: UvrD-helicase domain-containing protein, partial [Cryobacterium sp.]|nr:UvrD-helicase domain-containing protein [Cryobacterium sp.]